jgi:RND family efflux transporter MFP subunit
MTTRHLAAWLSYTALALAAVTASNAAQAPGKNPVVPVPPLVIRVARPVTKVVTDYEVFTGRTEASATVELRARASGYLTRVLFKDGAEVKQGELLFEIDPRPYRAKLDRAQVALDRAEVRRKMAEADLKRADALARTVDISNEERNKLAAAQADAQAAVRLAQVDREVAQLNLDFTRVTAPISGRIGRRLLDPGNVVKADETFLATIVREDPLYVYFDVDETTALRLRREKMGPKVPVTAGFAGEKGFPHRGMVDFVANRVAPATGTLRVRAVLPNADGLLMPGLFVRVRLDVGQPHKALLVPAKAVLKDRGQAYVWVVKGKDKVERRLVRLGSTHDGLRVIEEGLRADDRVVIGGLQWLQAGMTVLPQEEKSYR